VREIRLRLTQSFAFFTRQLAFNGNAGEIGNIFRTVGKPYPWDSLRLARDLGEIAMGGPGSIGARSS
jgi:hypothetical protein